MNREWFQLKSILLIAGAAFVLGCPNAQDVANQMSALLTREQAQYELIQQNSSVRGEAMAGHLDAWVTTVGQLSQSLSQIASRLEKKPEERAGVEVELDRMADRLDEMFSRVGAFNLTAVPSWQMAEVQASAAQAKLNYLTLRQTYQKVFGRLAGGASTLNISVEQDAELYDTKNDCLDRLRFFAMAHNDQSCVDYGTRYCGHQVDLDCVSRVLLLNATNDCTRTTFHKGSDALVILPADWMGQLGNCRSPILVTRKL